MERKLESKITAEIMQYLKTLDKCFFWKEHGGMYGTAGIPDIICCYHGKFLAFEVKRPGEQPTKLQQKTMKDIQAAGGQAYVVRSVEDVKKCFESPSYGLNRRGKGEKMLKEIEILQKENHVLHSALDKVCKIVYERKQRLLSIGEILQIEDALNACINELLTLKHAFSTEPAAKVEENGTAET